MKTKRHIEICTKDPKKPRSKIAESISLNVPTGYRAKIEEAAETEGITLRRYILKAIEEKMQMRHTGGDMLPL